MTKRTPLYEEHKLLNARFTEFGGWDMPVQYTSIMDEHTAVRRSAGIFDTSHMGIFTVSGKDSTPFLEKVTVSNIAAIEPWQAKYSLLLNDAGGIIDDLIIYRRPDDYLLVVNAGNSEKDFEWLSKHAGADTRLDNISAATCLLALQGPDAESLLQPMVKDNLGKLKYFRFMPSGFVSVNPRFSMIARTGYTGEDGFELFVSDEAAVPLWKSLVAAGAKPCGLGARDTLRLEACMPLHGHEINDDITPLEAELDRTVYWEKDFIGKKALLKQRQSGITRFLTAFTLDSGIPRAHCEIMHEGKHAGSVTSGTYSPTFKKGLGLGYTGRPFREGETIHIIIHGQPRPAEVVKKPFYSRKK